MTSLRHAFKSLSINAHPQTWHYSRSDDAWRELQVQSRTACLRLAETRRDGQNGADLAVLTEESVAFVVLRNTSVALSFGPQQTFTEIRRAPAETYVC